MGNKKDAEWKKEDNVHVSVKQRGSWCGRRDKKHIPQAPSSKDYP